MAKGNDKICVEHVGNAHYLYDVSLIENIADTALFEHDNRLSVASSTSKTAIGRGLAVYFTYENLNLVYKHYQRGGLIATFLDDKYFGIIMENTRAFREWRLLHHMQSLNLPAPVPIATRVISTGLFYRADMLMKEIEATTLADLCLKSDVDKRIWRNIGRCIKQFHDADIYHADLNARNILIKEDGSVYLIDFDKAYVRLMGDSWKVSNLSRLNRSLVKFQRLSTHFYFSQANWTQLLNAYNE